MPQKIGFDDLRRAAAKHTSTTTANATAVCSFAQQWLCQQLGDEFGKVATWQQGILRVHVVDSNWGQKVFWQQDGLLTALAAEFPEFTFRGVRVVK